MSRKYSKKGLETKPKDRSNTEVEKTQTVRNMKHNYYLDHNINKIALPKRCGLTDSQNFNPAKYMAYTVYPNPDNLYHRYSNIYALYALSVPHLF